MPSVGKKPDNTGAKPGGPKPTSIEQNHAPSLDLNTASSGTSTSVYYHVGGPLTKIAPCASVLDGDSADFQGGSLRVSLTGNGTATDQLAIITDATVTLTGNDNSGNRGVKINGTLVGTLSGGQNGSDLVISLHSSATPALVEILLEHVGYFSSNASTLPRTVTFTLIDGGGVANGGSDTASATATITYGAQEPTNVAPMLTGDRSADVAEGSNYRLTSADLSFSDPDDGAAGVTFTISNCVNGMVKINGIAATSFTGQQLLDGLVAFEHDGSETGAATFDVSVEDGNEDGSTPASSTFTFKVSAVNDAPVLMGDMAAAVTEGGSAVLTAADLGFSDPDDSASGVTFTVSNSSNGVVKVNGVAATSFTGQQLQSGMVSFTHDGSETTAASFNVAVEDGNEDGSAPVPGTFNLTVSPVNDAPVIAGDLLATVNEGGSYTLTATDLAVNDPDDNASGVTFTVSNQLNGTVKVNGVAAASFTGQQLQSGVVTFTHDGSETTAASFNVLVEDGNEDGSAPSPSTFNFTVNPVNDAPVIAGDLMATVNEGGSYTLTATDLAVNDPDDNASGVTFTVSNQLNGTVNVNGIAATSFTGQQLQSGMVSFAHDGFETTVASFNVVVEDGNEDGSAPTPSAFAFTVNPVNDAPVIAGDLAAVVDEGGSYTLTADDLAFSDPDDNGSGVTFTVANQLNGTVKVSGVAATSFTGQQLQSGVVTFTHDGSETTSASFNVVVEDGNEDGSAPGTNTFTFAVNPVNDAPVMAGDLAAEIVRAGSYTIKATDLGYVDPDDLASDVTFTVSNQLNGTVKVNGLPATSFTAQQLLDGLVKFTQDGWNTGTASFNVTVEDGNEDGSAPAAGTFSLTVLPANIDLTTLSPTQGFIIVGDAAADNAGWSVSSAGDVNGDGFDDLLVGAPRGGLGGFESGQAYLVFGKAAPFGVIDLTSFTASDGFVIRGGAGFDHAGWSVSSAGDVNGDGFDDMIVGVPLGDDGGTNAGEAYVLFGKANGFGSVIDLAAPLPSSAGFVIQADAADDNAGLSVSAAGDVNGDGFDDLIIGAPGGDDGGNSAGEAYVVFGKASGFGTIDLTTLTSSNGFIIQGDTASDMAGWSVSAAGDVNGDGLADLMLGAPRGDNGGTDAGQAYVVFGKTTGFGTPVLGRQVLDLTMLSPSDGFIIQGDRALDQAGLSVSSAGDVNGDGFDDLIIGTPNGGDGGAFAGEAYVVFGKASGFGTIDLTTFSAANGFIIQGDAAGDQAGYSVSAAGDVNGDGFGDLIVGAPTGDNGGSDAGEAYVLFGKASGFGTADITGRQVIDLSNLAFPDGFIIQGDVAGDHAGWSVSAAGDVNNDGFADLIIGAPTGDNGGNNAGEAYVIFGSAFWLP